MAGIARIGRATRRFIRERADLAGVALITAEMAVTAADLADAARREGKPREALAALKELRELLGELDRKAAGGEPGAGDGPTGGEPGPAEQLESLLGAGPAVGD